MISCELYHRYWNSVSKRGMATDKMLLQMDSIILYNDSPYWLLTTRALENRVYPSSYKSRIRQLAFEKGNRDAVYYLCNWYKADNYNDLKQALIKYLQRTDFSKTGTTDYYKTVEELLKFGGNDIEKIITQKLQKDKHWKYEEAKFRSLLEENSVVVNVD
jgi:hypothetical protein